MLLADVLPAEELHPSRRNHIAIRDQETAFVQISMVLECGSLKDALEEEDGEDEVGTRCMVGCEVYMPYGREHGVLQTVKFYKYLINIQ